MHVNVNTTAIITSSLQSDSATVSFIDNIKTNKIKQKQIVRHNSTDADIPA